MKPANHGPLRMRSLEPSHTKVVRVQRRQCQCLCHDTFSMPHNEFRALIHKDKCVCNGGTGFTDGL